MVAVKSYQDLFNQASTQLNFLLLSQRNMILVMAFALAFLGFATNFKHRIIIRVLIFSLLVYSFLLGLFSTIDYKDYIGKTREELERQNFDDGEDLLDTWSNWVNFTYALLALNGLLIIFWILYEIDYQYSNISKKRPTHLYWATLGGDIRTDSSRRSSSKRSISFRKRR